MSANGVERYVWRAEHKLAASRVFHHLLAVREGLPTCNTFVHACIREVFSMETPEGIRQALPIGSRPSARQFRCCWEQLKQEASPANWWKPVPELAHRPRAARHPLCKPDFTEALSRSAHRLDWLVVDRDYLCWSAGISSVSPVVLIRDQAQERRAATQRMLAAALESRVPIFYVDDARRPAATRAPKNGPNDDFAWQATVDRLSGSHAITHGE